MRGRTIKGMATSTSPDSLGLVTTIMTSAPISMIELRTACESAEPVAAVIWVVSAVMRLISSPDRCRSKKAASRMDRCAKTLARRSATTRSPSQFTA